MPTQEHIRDGPSPEIRRPGPLRAIEQPGSVSLLTERLPNARSFVSEHSRQQPRYDVDHDRRGQFPSAQDEVADRQLFVGQVRGDALIDALVASADQKNFVGAA